MLSSYVIVEVLAFHIILAAGSHRHICSSSPGRQPTDMSVFPQREGVCVCPCACVAPVFESSSKSEANAIERKSI